MSALSRKVRLLADNDGTQRLAYWCQGCDENHAVIIKGGPPGPWGWNGDAASPTFTPSVLYRRDLWTPPVTPENIEQWRAAPWEQKQVHHVCHTFITDGMVQFLGDCTHALAGQTLPLPDLPEHLKD